MVPIGVPFLVPRICDRIDLDLVPFLIPSKCPDLEPILVPSAYQRIDKTIIFDTKDDVIGFGTIFGT